MNRLKKISIGYLTLTNERTNYMYQEYGDCYTPYSFERKLYTPGDVTNIWIHSFYFQPKSVFNIEDAVTSQINKMPPKAQRFFIGYTVENIPDHSKLNITLICLEGYEESLLLTNREFKDELIFI